MVKMSYHTKNEVSMSRHSKVIACTDTHRHRHTHTHTDADTHTDTHREYENITFPHTRAVKICLLALMIAIKVSVRIYQLPIRQFP